MEWRVSACFRSSAAVSSATRSCRFTSASSACSVACSDSRTELVTDFWSAACSEAVSVEERPPPASGVAGFTGALVAADDFHTAARFGFGNGDLASPVAAVGDAGAAAAATSLPEAAAFLSRFCS